MFYPDTILCRKGPLSCIWLAAHFERRLNRSMVNDIDLARDIKGLLDGTGIPPLALRLKGQLLFGIVKIFCKKTRYLLEDCYEIVHKINVDVVIIKGKTNNQLIRKDTNFDRITIPKEISKQHFMDKLGEGEGLKHKLQSVLKMDVSMSDDKIPKFNMDEWPELMLNYDDLAEINLSNTSVQNLGDISSVSQVEMGRNESVFGDDLDHVSSYMHQSSENADISIETGRETIKSPGKNTGNEQISGSFENMSEMNINLEQSIDNNVEMMELPIYPYVTENLKGDTQNDLNQNNKRKFNIRNIKEDNLLLIDHQTELVDHNIKKWLKGRNDIINSIKECFLSCSSYDKGRCIENIFEMRTVNMDSRINTLFSLDASVQKHAEPIVEKDPQIKEMDKTTEKDLVDEDFGYSVSEYDRNLQEVIDASIPLTIEYQLLEGEQSVPEIKGESHSEVMNVILSKVSHIKENEGVDKVDFLQMVENKEDSRELSRLFFEVLDQASKGNILVQQLEPFGSITITTNT